MCRRSYSRGAPTGGEASYVGPSYVGLVFGGFILGLIVGRWWALAVPAGFGAWIAVNTPIEDVPPWFLGAGLAALPAVGIAASVGVRHWIRSRS
jgi:hypothetical protein